MPFVLPEHRRQDMKGVSRMAYKQDKNKYLLYKASRRAFCECVVRNMSGEEFSAVKGLLNMSFPPKTHPKPLAFDILHHLEASRDRVAGNYQRIDPDHAYESICMYLDTLDPPGTTADVHAHVYSLIWEEFGWLRVHKPPHRKVKVELAINSRTFERWNQWCFTQQFYRDIHHARTFRRFRYNRGTRTYCMTVHCADDVEFVKEQLEAIFAVQPRKLSFD
jgi:hypothetical protein